MNLDEMLIFLVIRMVTLIERANAVFTVAC